MCIDSTLFRCLSSIQVAPRDVDFPCEGQPPAPTLWHLFEWWLFHHKLKNVKGAFECELKKR
jgi:hypothetical protein